MYGASAINKMKTKNWEKEFDRKVKKINYRDYGIDWEDIKSFISNLLAEQKKSLISEIEGMKDDRDEIEGETEKIFNDGYDQALNDIKKLLEN